MAAFSAWLDWDSCKGLKKRMLYSTCKQRNISRIKCHILNENKETSQEENIKYENVIF